MLGMSPQQRLSEVAYTRILEALFSRRVELGSFVSQADLTAVTGVGVGPVRDALKLLEADGILTIRPRSGIQVMRATTELARSTYQFRSIIERAAARQFALSTKAKAIDELTDMHEETLADFADADRDLSSDLSRIEDRFHGGVVASLANEIVDAAYRRLQLLARIVKLDGIVTRHTATLSLREHLDVLAGARARDPDAAEAAMGRHLANALQRNLGLDGG